MDTYCIYDSTPFGTLNPRGERRRCGCESETMDFNLLIMIAMMVVCWALDDVASAQKRQRKQMEELRAMQQFSRPRHSGYDRFRLLRHRRQHRFR